MIEFIYSDFWKWYYDYQDHHDFFTNEPDIEYRFYYKNPLTGIFELNDPLNPYSFSKSLNFIHRNYRHSHVLHSPFDKIYLQFEPRNGTLYFITPGIYTDNDDFVWGDHYRFHYVWAEEKMINGVNRKISDIVGFHKTAQNLNRRKADHTYCNFENKYQFSTDVNNVIDPRSFDNLQCIHLMNFNRQYICVL